LELIDRLRERIVLKYDQKTKECKAIRKNH